MEANYYYLPHCCPGNYHPMSLSMLGLYTDGRSYVKLGIALEEKPPLDKIPHLKPLPLEKILYLLLELQLKEEELRRTQDNNPRQGYMTSFKIWSTN